MPARDVLHRHSGEGRGLNAGKDRTRPEVSKFQKLFGAVRNGRSVFEKAATSPWQPTKAPTCPTGTSMNLQALYEAGSVITTAEAQSAILIRSSAADFAWFMPGWSQAATSALAFPVSCSTKWPIVIRDGMACGFMICHNKISTGKRLHGALD